MKGRREPGDRRSRYHPPMGRRVFFVGLWIVATLGIGLAARTAVSFVDRAVFPEGQAIRVIDLPPSTTTTTTTTTMAVALPGDNDDLDHNDHARRPRRPVPRHRYRPTTTLPETTTTSSSTTTTTIAVYPDDDGAHGTDAGRGRGIGDDQVLPERRHAGLVTDRRLATRPRWWTRAPRTWRCCSILTPGRARASFAAMRGRRSRFATLPRPQTTWLYVSFTSPLQCRDGVASTGRRT